MINDQLIYAYKKARNHWFTAKQAIGAARRNLETGEKFYGASWPWALGAGNVTRQRKERPGDNYAWIENTESAGMRFAGFADELAPRAVNHKGWYNSPDNIFGEVYRGAVWQLPGRDGVARFLAGYVAPDSGGAAFVCLDIISEAPLHCEQSQDKANDDAKREAALRADSIAEREAEKEREYNEQWQAGARWSDLGEQCADIRRELLALLGEMKAERKARGASGETICKTLRAAVRNMLADIEKMRGERAEPFRGYGDSDGFAEHLPRAN